jgi:hypothetical protein
MPSGFRRARPQTRWCHTSFLQLPTVLMMARGSSGGGSLHTFSFALMLVEKTQIDKKVFLQGPDTIISCYLFSLCLSVLPSIVALITLVVLGVQLLQISKLFKKGKTEEIF